MKAPIIELTLWEQMMLFQSNDKCAIEAHTMINTICFAILLEKSRKIIILIFLDQAVGKLEFSIRTYSAK